MKISNPDKNRIYDVWHFCLRCGQTLVHSTAILRDHAEHCGYEPSELLTFSTEIDEVVIPPVKCEICGKDTIQVVRLVDGRQVCLSCWRDKK